MRSNWYYLKLFDVEKLLSQRGHFNPFILKPHFLQWEANEIASWDGVLIAFIINMETIRIPIARPIHIRTM